MNTHSRSPIPIMTSHYKPISPLLPQRRRCSGDRAGDKIGKGCSHKRDRASSRAMKCADKARLASRNARLALVGGVPQGLQT